jgi:hypothetical protein
MENLATGLEVAGSDFESMLRGKERDILAHFLVVILSRFSYSKNEPELCPLSPETHRV